MTKKTLNIIGVAAAVLLCAAGLAVWLGRSASPNASNPGAGLTTSTIGPGAETSSLPALPPSQADLAPAAVDAPLASGVPLPPLSSSPADLISSFEAGLVPSGSSYAITLRPWGMGPIAPGGRTVVITLDSIVPVGTAPDAFVGFRNRAILVVMDAAHGGTIERGGSYSAILTFVTSDGQLVPILSKVTSQGS
jgi:hypothetical protein